MSKLSLLGGDWEKGVYIRKKLLGVRWNGYEALAGDMFI